MRILRDSRLDSWGTVIYVSYNIAQDNADKVLGLLFDVDCYRSTRHGLPIYVGEMLFCSMAVVAFPFCLFYLFCLLVH